MSRTHSILIEDMRTGCLATMEFYTFQAALDAIEAICSDMDKTVHGPYVLGAAEADETSLVSEIKYGAAGRKEDGTWNEDSSLDEYISERWVLNSEGQVTERAGKHISGDPDHPIIEISIMNKKPEITD
jgi:hypothetical protein